MVLTKETKQQIIAALARTRQNFSGSDAKFAVSIDINSAQYSRIKKGETEHVLSDAKWISLARRADVQLGNEKSWLTAETPVFRFITTQLLYCQNNSTNGLLCDKSDIGKTHAAKVYCKQHKNAVYIDCSQVKSKQKLVRAICKQFGIDSMGKYAEVYADLVYYLKALDQPLIILDEAGDLDYGAFLELKALWNATENHCAWYMMGADGLEKKMQRGIENKKVGYTEIFSRYGAKYQHVVPLGTDDNQSFLHDQASMIIRANANGKVDENAMIRKTNGSLRRIRIELNKLKHTA